MFERTLVTFLQAVRRTKERPKELPEFQPANYDFGSQAARNEKLCGLALLDHMTARNQAPTQLVALGTPGSSWGRLIAHVLGDGHDRALAELDRACEASIATEEELKVWVPAIEEVLKTRAKVPKFKVAFRITGYASDEDGQREMIRLIADNVGQGGRLVIDATHSLRHLPLIGVFSAMVLRRLKSVTLDGVYYGALERTAPDASGNPLTPVWRLDGLPRFADWLTALSAFDKDGDYGVFVDLLCDAGFDRKAAGNLGEAAFNEMIGNFEEAKLRLLSFRKAFEIARLSGAARLFHEELMSRTAWVTGDMGPYEHQRHLALAALDRGDVVRATMWGFEAFNTKLTLRYGRNPLLQYERTGAREDFKREPDWGSEHFACDRLYVMRNQIAHTDFRIENNDLSRAEVLRLMSKREPCLNALRDYLEVLLAGGIK